MPNPFQPIQIMKTNRFLLALCLTSALIFSCNSIKEVSMIYNTEVKPTQVMLQDKSILLTPIVHFGQQEFYDNLRDSVVAWKGKGYTVFYEELNIGPHERDVPVEEYEVIFRKFRKMTGGSPTREQYVELEETFEGGVSQPSYEFLGVDSTDFNADVTIKEFVEEYERLYGTLQLTPCDLNTPLDSTFTCGGVKENMKPVIDDFRNEMLVKQLVEAEEKKIVVLYGAIHIKPVKKMLKEFQ